MILSIIVAFDENRCMGSGKSLPWKIKQEMEFFKNTTTGFPVIMGRKTWESIPEKFRPLPGRFNIVMTKSWSTAETLPESVSAASSLEGAIRLAEESGHEKAFIIGGLEIYKQAMQCPKLDKMLVSHIKGIYSGTVFYPEIDDTIWDYRLILDCPKFAVYEYFRK